MNEVLRLRVFLGLILVALVASAGTWYFGSRYFHGLPPLGALTRFDDEVLGVSEREPETRFGSPYIEVRFLNKNARYRYPANFPHHAAILSLHMGDRVEVWADLQNDYLIRQLRKGDAMVVSYDELGSTLRSERWRNAAYALVEAAIALSALYAGFTKFSFNAREPRRDANSDWMRP